MKTVKSSEGLRPVRPEGLRPGDLRPGDLRPEGLRPGDLRPGDLRPGDLRPEGLQPKVLSKIQNYALWRSGEYGNKLRAWRSYDEWSKSGFSGLVALRTLGPGGGPCIYDLYPSSVKFHYEILLRTGISANQIMFNEMAPNSIGSIILQGEYLNDIFTLNDIVCWSYFYYSRAQHPMRDALKKSPEIAVNMKADLLLRLAMTPASYEDWLGLLDKYYGHVLEVSVFDHCLGDTPNRNALVWEVRKY